MPAASNLVDAGARRWPRSLASTSSLESDDVVRDVVPANDQVTFSPTLTVTCRRRVVARRWCRRPPGWWRRRWRRAGNARTAANAAARLGRASHDLHLQHHRLVGVLERVAVEHVLAAVGREPRPARVTVSLGSTPTVSFQPSLSAGSTGPLRALEHPEQEAVQVHRVHAVGVVDERPDLRAAEARAGVDAVRVEAEPVDLPRAPMPSARSQRRRAFGAGSGSGSRRRARDAEVLAARRRPRCRSA